MIRITKPEKWKDTFFLNLKPIEKLLFIYLYENCDDAGFFDINFKKMSDDTGLNGAELTISLNRLSKAYLISADSDRIWLKKFLLHQNKIPLDLKTTEGNFIKYQIESNSEKFNNPNEFANILKNIKKLQKAKSDFIKPSLEEVVEKFKEGEWSFMPKQEIVNIYDYYESVGWKVGSKKMADWNKAFINCFRRNNKFKNGSNGGNRQQPQPQSKMDTIIKENEKLKNFDFNQLKTV